MSLGDCAALPLATAGLLTYSQAANTSRCSLKNLSSSAQSHRLPSGFLGGYFACRGGDTLESHVHAGCAGPQLFLAWAAWACVWAAIMILALTAAGACRYIHLFTRFSGELFGALIAVRDC